MKIFGRNVTMKVREKGRPVVEARNLRGMIIGRGLPLAVAALMIAMNAAAQTSAAWTGGCAGVSANTVGNVAWTPALCQEFNSTTVGPPETAPWSVWSYDLGSGGFGNNEAETYCGPPGYPGNPANCPATFDPATANSYVDGQGHLDIQIVNNDSGTWNSARMTTQNTQAFQYGRIEASAELPDLSSPGLWPAFWWLGRIFPRFRGRRAASRTSWKPGQIPPLAGRRQESPPTTQPFTTARVHRTGNRTAGTTPCRAANR